MTIKILVNGAQGKMGRETVNAIENDSNLTLVGALGRSNNLSEAIKQNQAQVVIDFTEAKSVFENTSTIIQAGVHPIIGSSGLTSDQISELTQHCADKKLGGIIAPNFSIGAILMMKYARDAAKYFNYAEIIEAHHEQKKDSPSGTAIKTSEIIAENLKPAEKLQGQIETLSGSRGAMSNGIPIHAIRMAGVVAKQDVIFGENGETLTISHNSINRESFMPGVILACKKVVELDKLIYGLEDLL